MDTERLELTFDDAVAFAMLTGRPEMLPSSATMRERMAAVGPDELRPLLYVWVDYGLVALGELVTMKQDRDRCRAMIESFLLEHESEPRGHEYRQAIEDLRSCLPEPDYGQ